MQASNSRITDLGVINDTGIDVARLFKYFSQFSNPNIIRTIPFVRVSAVIFYNAHKKTFNRLAKAFSSALDRLPGYISFAVNDLKITEYDIDSRLACSDSVRKYAENLDIMLRMRVIYDSIIRSARNLADYCIENNIFTAKDGLKSLISEKRLAAWFVCGKITEYYLAAIPGFEKIIPRLDSFSRKDLDIISERYDVYNTAANEAFIRIRNIKANPIGITDRIIAEKRNQRK